jgi:hypothetical protein
MSNFLTKIFNKAESLKVGRSFRNIGQKNDTSAFEIKKLRDKVVYKGYRNIIQRDIIMPNGKEVSFDILNQPEPSVIIFIWNSTSSTCTLIKEYHPGIEKIIYGTVAGMYEGKKHSSILEAAKHELEEEAQLHTNNLIPLLDDFDTSTPFDKYSNNRFYPFLALNCEAVNDPQPMDDEEYIIVEHGISYSRLMDMILKGEINIVSTYSILLGIRKLRSLGIIDDTYK